MYLKEGEIFTIDELLYALMVQSGNDAAIAFAAALLLTHSYVAMETHTHREILPFLAPSTNSFSMTAQT